MVWLAVCVVWCGVVVHVADVRVRCVYGLSVCAGGSGAEEEEEEDEESGVCHALRVW